MRTLYTILLYLLAPLVLLRLAIRGLRNPEYRDCWSERLGAVHPAVGEHVIWVHAVSVGEVQAAESMIRALLELYPEYSILMTTVTATGAAHVRELFGDEVAHAYAPYDLPDVGVPQVKKHEVKVSTTGLSEGTSTLNSLFSLIP